MVPVSVINMTSALLIPPERRPMVGLLKALGMPDASVMRGFLAGSPHIGRGFLWGNFAGLGLVAPGATGWVALNPEAYYLDVVRCVWMRYI